MLIVDTPESKKLKYNKIFKDSIEYAKEFSEHISHLKKEARTRRL